MCKKANIVLFPACDPHVKTVLFSTHYLSLYGGVLCSWNPEFCKQRTKYGSFTRLGACAHITIFT